GPTAGKIFRAMYDYMAADADEVSFKDGDAIINVQAIDEGWMYGTVQRTGRTGMLPANYVEAIGGGGITTIKEMGRSIHEIPR
uniref:Nebulin,Nuclear receptor corepressor 1 n=1 Tax=Homo sapiens TaxID=9606 RepID=UPI0018AF5406|nr:Chain C, Nebulin,Nuclear receptor corepressor 1 [Homo sapiens]6Y17_D Chain D, Nebulin,Nuclear receptor corepressor 1 [Homo sapiens]